MTGNELVKAVETHGLATVVHEGRDTILITMVVAMAMRIVAFVMVMAVAMWVVAFVVVLMMLMLVVVVMMIMLVMVVMMIMLVMVVMMMLLLHVALYLLNPCSGSGYMFEIKELGIENLAKRHIAVVTFDDLCFGLNSANDGYDLLSFRFANF